MAPPPPTEFRWWQRAGWRRTVFGLNTASALALAALLVAAVNFLALRHYARGDWSRSGFYQLGPKSLHLLGALTNDVQVTVLLQMNQELYWDVDNLLKEYQQASPRVRVARVDPDRDLARTEELRRRYDLKEPNVVIFSTGGRSKVVSPREIQATDYSGVLKGRAPTRGAFQGEEAFTSALHTLLEPRVPTLYFLQGHGERDIADFNRSSGYSGLAQRLKRDNLEVRRLVLGENQPGLPADCDALVIAGPIRRFSSQELDVLNGYLERQGRLLALLDARTAVGLDPLLARWGVRLAEDVVIDATRTLTGRELIVAQYPAHPITRPLAGITTIFYLPRSVEALNEASGHAPDKPHATALAACSEAGWAETALDENPMKFDATRDEPGPVSIAVAVERGPVPGLEVQIRPARLVVVGDSDFLANGALTGGNEDFALSALNWLLEREPRLGISPKRPEQYQLVLTRRQLNGLLAVVLGGLPGLVALLGVAVWWRRRH